MSLISKFALTSILRIKDRSYLVLLLGGAGVLTISVILFQLFLKMSADEIVTGWLKSEQINIQQGNLLTSVSKSQNLIIGGGFVKGIRLNKTRGNSVIELINMGRTPRNIIPLKVGDIFWTREGFFEWSASYKFPSDPTLIISFLFYSEKGVALFWSYIFLLLLLITFSGIIIAAMEKAESLQRETILKSAIERLIGDEEVPEILRINVPTLVNHWQTFKDLLKLHNDQEKRIAKQEIIDQIAHDIRSPLSSLNLITNKIDTSDDYKLILIESVARINNIASGILRNPKITDSPRIANKTPQNDKNTDEEISHLLPLVDQIIREKKIQVVNKMISIHEDYSTASDNITIKNSTEFSRALSNLLANSIESIDKDGWIRVSISNFGSSAILVIHDNGRGIPKDIFHRIGERGFSFNKENGNGLGLFHAKRTINALGGNLEIQSKEGSGTMITIKLPVQKFSSKDF